MKLWPTTTENKCFVKMLWHVLGECVKTTVLLVCLSGIVATVAIEFFFFFFQSFVCTFFKKIFIKTNMWGPVISGVLLRLYVMGLRPNDQIRGHWQVRGWSAKVITGVALKEELKVFMVIPNLSEVKSHLRTFVRGDLKHSYPSRYSFKGTLWWEVEYWILDEGGG